MIAIRLGAERVDRKPKMLCGIPQGYDVVIADHLRPKSPLSASARQAQVQSGFAFAKPRLLNGSKVLHHSLATRGKFKNCLLSIVGGKGRWQSLHLADQSVHLHFIRFSPFARDARAVPLILPSANEQESAPRRSQSLWYRDMGRQ